MNNGKNKQMPSYDFIIWSVTSPVTIYFPYLKLHCATLLIYS